jgi:hypothetical protein
LAGDLDKFLIDDDPVSGESHATVPHDDAKQDRPFLTMVAGAEFFFRVHDFNSVFIV